MTRPPDAAEVAWYQRWRDAEAENERLRAALEWISRVLATEQEYKRVARNALDDVT